MQKKKATLSCDFSFWQITLIWIQSAPHSLTKALETKRFSASCTRLLFLLDLMDYSVQSGFFVFTSEIEKLIKSNRVKDGVIVCEMGIRVRDTCTQIHNF